jgi:hypothetical protein
VLTDVFEEGFVMWKVHAYVVIEGEEFLAGKFSFREGEQCDELLL